MGYIIEINKYYTSIYTPMQRLVRLRFHSPVDRHITCSILGSDLYPMLHWYSHSVPTLGSHPPDTFPVTNLVGHFIAGRTFLYTRLQLV